MNLKNHNFSTTLLVLFLIAIGSRSASAEEILLKRTTGRVVEATADGERYWYDQTVSPEDARKVFDYFRKMVDDPVPQIHAVPGMKDSYVVSTWAGADEAQKDFGRRLYLIKKAGAAFEQIDRTKGQGDSYILEPVFFAGSGKRLILAEIGTEYSWGLVVYEIAQGRLKELGPLDAAVDDGETTRDPTPYAKVRYVNGKWLIEFDHDLVLDPGGLTDRTIRRKGRKPIVFRFDGNKFIPREGTYTPVLNGEGL